MSYQIPMTKYQSESQQADVIRDKQNLPLLAEGLYCYDGKTLAGVAGVRHFDGSLYKVKSIDNDLIAVEEELEEGYQYYRGKEAHAFASQLVPLAEEQIHEIRRDRERRFFWIKSGKVSWE